MINAMISGQDQYSKLFCCPILTEWKKPSYCSFVYILAVGGGGGGGGGGATSASATIGGSGGASGSCVAAFFNAATIPETLLIQPGVGGAGGTGHINGAGGTNGSAGTDTFVYFSTNGTNRAILKATAGGGGNVASTTGGTPTAINFTNANFYRPSIAASIQGASGTAGGNGNANGTNSSFAANTNAMLLGGTGGGGASTGSTIYQGGVATLPNPYPAYFTETLVAGTQGLPGAEFFNKPYGYFITGGKGGQCSRTTAVPGGRGGDGLLGSGGGGGGAFRGDTTTQGGSGGKGGDGWVLIIAR